MRSLFVSLRCGWLGDGFCFVCWLYVVLVFFFGFLGSSVILAENNGFFTGLVRGWVGVFGRDLSDA